MSLVNKNLLTKPDLKKIENILGKERYQHTRFVLESAVKLAKNLNLNQQKVKTAALLHDIAKSKTDEELKIILKDSQWSVDDLEASITPILHAPAGAVIAKNEFGVEDQEILEAIRFHTLGHPEMGQIAQVIYAADFISEDRQFPALEIIRKEIERDFELGLYLITNNIIKYQLEQDNFIHPYSNDLRNKLLKRSD